MSRRDEFIEWNKKLVARQAQGFVVRSYDIKTDGFVWLFGTVRIPFLEDMKDDPKGHLDEFPVSELMDYLIEYYWPKSEEMALPRLRLV